MRKRKKVKNISGILSITRKGFGFVIPFEDEEYKEDIFIPAKGLNGGFDGDKVRVTVERYTDKASKLEGKVVEILERDKEEFVGTFEKVKSYGFVIPENKKIHKDIFVESDNLLKAKDGDKVCVEIIKWPKDGYSSPEGKIKSIIAGKNDPGADIKAMIIDAGIKTEFPHNVKEEVKKIPAKVRKKDISGRADFRDKRIVTIDGSESKDFDDGVSLEINDKGEYILGVHIADVSHYVEKDSALDKEALKRGNSIYLINQVVPMLPEKLSNGICSLNPEVERLTLSIIMKLDKNGKLLEHEICESVICSKARLVYDEVSDLIEGKNTALYKREPEISKDLILMGELAKKLAYNRKTRGSIEFDFDEPHIILDSKGRAKEINIAERRTANRLIEEFMLLANETIAEHFFWLEEPFIYRVHEKPDADKIREIREYIITLGMDIKLSNKGIHSRAINGLLEKVKGKPYETVISTLLLRSMKKAYYDINPLGHFGLAAKYYCHFTSPIRRYPDLMIHRIIKDIINNNITREESRKKYAKIMAFAAENSSVTERKAIELEREVNKLKMAEYMSNHIGETYEGIISGVTGYGFFVQLPNTIEGLVRVETLRGDFYEYESQKLRLTGRKRRKTFVLGQEVKVVVSSVNTTLREIEFEIV